MQGGHLTDGKTSDRFLFDDCVIVELDEANIPEGQVFAGWTKTGSDKIISYNKTYSFLVRESTTVTAVYAESDVTAVPAVVMYEHSFYMDVEAGSFNCERNVPDGYTYTGSGILVTGNEITGESTDAFVIGANYVDSHKANGSALNANFSVVYTDVTKKLYGRAYLTYKNTADEEITIYSDIEIYDPYSELN